MTVDEAMNAVHDFRGATQQEADAKCDEINPLIESKALGPMVPINFEGLGWGCMFQQSAAFIGLFPQTHHVKNPKKYGMHG